VPLPRGLSHLPDWPFAVDRLDMWVLKVSIAIPLVCIAGLVLWQFVAYLIRKLPRKPRRAARVSPEPPSRQSLMLPERLQKACTDLEDSLAARYIELAESWLRSGQPQKAAATLNKVLRLCPERSQAQVARDRLEQIGKQGEAPHS
jgi:hypothetical protein